MASSWILVLVPVLVPVLVLAQTHAETMNIMVMEGDDAILPCAISDGAIRALEWTRPDLMSPENIFFFCDGRLDKTYQTSSFRDRVQLLDSGPKLQDLSLRIRNVTSRDKGTYECRVAAGRGSATRQKRAMISNDPLSIITLEVTGSRTRDQAAAAPAGGTALYVGLGAAVVLLSFIVGLVLGLKFNRTEEKKRDVAAADLSASRALV